jgi:aspartate aminotransferase-like enzyme
MKNYPIPMVPGPVQVHQQILDIYQNNFGSPDLEPEFLELYNQTESNMQQIMQTDNKIVLHTGEGMIALWGALKSCLSPGDKVLSIATGVFGYGIGDMAKSIGAQVKTLGFPYNETMHNWEKIEEAIIEYQPKMITAVHCETPSGTLNPINLLGELKNKHNVPLLYMDIVASVGGTEIKTDEWHIDLALGGSQKAISAPPDTSFLAVSPKAWEIISQVNYVGYDALLPFQKAQENFYFPYTPNWRGIAALNTASDMILQEGLNAVYLRHEQVASYFRQQLKSLGYELFPDPDAIPAPTVTAVLVPNGITWLKFDSKLRKEGLVVGGSYGPLAEKVFRLGHMGSQANMVLAHRALEVLEKVKI